MNLDRVIDSFVDKYEEDLSLGLMKTLAYPEQGGLGYSVKFFNPALDLDGWEVDHATRTIYLDEAGVLSKNSPTDLAEALRNALETEILKTRASLVSQVGWGTGKVLLGVLETGVGLIGILVPAPGTTVAGVVVVVLGANTVADGFTQLAGANRGHGYNALGEGAAFLGGSVADLAGFDRALGQKIGTGVFLVGSVALGSYASIRILRIPGQTMLRMGVGGRPGGLQIGRLDLMYGSEKAKDGLTILSINNNANQSFLRFVLHDGRLVVNGRIVGVARVLNHESSAKEILKGLLKLLVHGAKH